MCANSRPDFAQVELASAKYLHLVGYPKCATHRPPIIVVFLNLEWAFDSIDATALFSVSHWMNMALKFVNILRALLSHPCDDIRICGELSSSFEASGGV